MSDANVKLSKSELILVCDEQFILTKNSIISKVYSLFGGLSEEFLSEIKNFKHAVSDEVVRLSPKIYRGENYKGLPYVMLDYPRYFSKEDAFAIRIFFWWGNFFSISLQLEGKQLSKYEDSVLSHLTDSWYICINKDKWEHHFEKDNYIIANSEGVDIYLNHAKRSFLKIAKKIPLKKWDEVYDYLASTYREILKMLAPLH
jgi:hypothetical protein